LTKRVFGFGNATNSSLLDSEPTMANVMDLIVSPFIKASVSVQSGHPVDFHASLLFFSHVYLYFLLFISLFTHSSHCIVTGFISPHLRHQLLKPSIEASASVSPL
jgi:hypothetical protein